MALTPDQNRIFDEYDRMFACEAWKMFTADVQANQDSLAQMILAPTSTEKDLWLCKGRNDVFKTILGLPSLMEQLKAMAEETYVEADAV